MDGSKENQHVFSVKSTERIGLRQILDPGTAKFRGYNVFHVVIAVIVVSILGVSSLCPFGFYHLSNDVDAFVFYLGTIQNFSFCVYKIVNIVYYSKDLWKCLNDTNFASMAYRRYDETAIIFESWRKRTWRVSFLYDAIVFISLASWIFVMFALSNTLITIRNPDGSYSQFRLNIGNVYFMVSDETYNRHFYKFFVVELTLYASYYYFSLLFDICLTIMCFSLSFQLDVIRSAIQSLGHETRSSRDNRLENTLEHDELCDVYEDLKTVLADHQNVMKNIGSFYNVIRPVTLIQILIASNTQILIWFLASLVWYLKFVFLIVLKSFKAGYQIV